MTSTAHPVPRRPALAAIVLPALALGAWRAWHWRWTTDDAFISFRYARNLVEGHGLVFNVGERVEGYSNFLWTLWCALGLRLGVTAEAWADLGSLTCYLATVLLLALRFSRRRSPEVGGWWLPPAALGAALMRDWNVFATGGLETAAYLFLVTASALTVADRPRAVARYAAAGLLAGLAALTRPEGLMPAAVIGAWVLWAAPGRVKAALAFAAAVALPVVPFLAWRVAYYGEWLPNTYRAKSAGIPWYSQGFDYAGLFFARYWVLLLGPLLLAFDRWRRGPGRADAGRERAMFGLLALACIVFVVRVGGDFMFARMLLPAAPFLWLLLEDGLRCTFRERPRVGQAALVALLAAMLWTPAPVGGERWRHGIADERAYYSERRVAVLDHAADVLGRAFDGLPVRVAFYGDEARIVYKARFPVAIESHAGLTDAFVARQPLERRGRVGHEKHAPLDYLIERRRVHFTFSEEARKLLPLRESIPEIVVRFGDGVYGQALHWDPSMMAALRSRGIEVPDFPAALDAYLAGIDRVPVERVRADYERIRRFYFEHVDDPAREAAFRRRLKEGSGG